MKCEACGCEDRWCGHDWYPAYRDNNLEIKFLLCECGHEQEEGDIDYER